MKSYKVISVLVIVLLISTPQTHADIHLSDKTTTEEVQQKVSDTTHSIKNYTVEKRDEAVKKVEEKLKSLDARIEALEERIDKNWDKMDKAARERARNTRTTLHKQRIRVAEWYGSLKNSSIHAWQHMKNGFLDAYSSLRNSWEKAEKEY